MHLAQLVLVSAALLAVAVVLGVFAQRVRLPPTVMLAVLGFGARWVGSRLGIAMHLGGETFEEIVVFVFLPVLVFEAALGLSTRSFFTNLGPILVLAIPALVISAVAVGLALWLVLGTSLAPALLFGALISATDPVAVVAVFRQLGVPRRLLTLVEGESLLNDGVAIVLATILLAVALGGQFQVGQAVLDFLAVFFGGALIGAVLGLAAALVVPWLDRLAAAALSVALAYGGFALADDVLGFSGVMATVAAGLVLSVLAPSRASREVREGWETLWSSLGYIANALLFLLIGLAIDPASIAAYPGAIALAIVVVLVARALGVVPLVSVLERLAGIPPVGRRNEAVLIWGGLRGGVALALALALPEELAERDLFVALTGGVVLATLLINATTIGALVHRLGLDRPSRSEQFLASSARLAGIAAARQRLADLGLEDPDVTTALDAAEHAARAELERIRLSPAHQRQVVTWRGLYVERETYQHLSDAGLLPPAAARTLLHEVDDQIEAATLDDQAGAALEHRERPTVDRLLERLTARLPAPIGDDPTELAYAEASARRLAARRTAEALDLFAQLPGVGVEAVAAAKQRFRRWEDDAIASLQELDAGAGADRRALHQRQAEALTRVAARDLLDELAAVGLLPERVAHTAAERVEAEVVGQRRGAADT